MIIKLSTEGQKNIVIGIYSVSAIDEDFPITAKDIGKATVLDPLLSRVLHFVMTGWPEKCDEEELKPYHIRSQELTMDFSPKMLLFCESNSVRINQNHPKHGITGKIYLC